MLDKPLEPLDYDYTGLEHDLGTNAMKQAAAEEEHRILKQLDRQDPGEYGKNGDGITAETANELLDESWRRVDLGPALRGEIERPEPTILTRDDGQALLYEGRVNGIHGDSGDGKTWVAYIAAAQTLASGRPVLWVDFEDDETVVVERLRNELAADDIAIGALFHYHRPTDPFSALAVLTLADDIAKDDIALTVIDSLGEAFSLEGVDEDRDVMVGPWLRRVARHLADAGAAVLLIDHSTKAKDNPLFPSGSKRKRAAITGASYQLIATTPLTREKGGKLQLVCAKDRHGNYKRGDSVATLDFHRYPDGGLVAKVWPPKGRSGEEPDERIRIIARAALRAAEKADRPVSQGELEELMKVKASSKRKRAGIDFAVGEGALRVESGPRNSKLHVYVKNLPEPTNEEDES